MSITIKLINAFITIHSSIIYFHFLMRTLKIYSQKISNTQYWINNYNKSPMLEQVLFQELVFKSNFFKFNKINLGTQLTQL